jgi:hypothetical protein
MADKNFKVKSGINIPINNAAILTTDSNGNISSTSILPVANGGTGQTTANNALNALLPIQNEGTTNYALLSDSLNTFWGQVYNQVIKDNGVTVNPRRSLNFIGASINDDPTNNTTNVIIGSSEYAEVLLTESITGMEIL